MSEHSVGDARAQEAQGRGIRWPGPSLGSATYKLPAHAQSLESCPTLCDPMGWGPPGSSVHGILRVRMLDCVAVPSSRKGMHLALFRCSPYVSLCSSVFLTQLSQGPVTPLRPPPQFHCKCDACSALQAAYLCAPASAQKDFPHPFWAWNQLRF